MVPTLVLCVHGNTEIIREKFVSHATMFYFSREQLFLYYAETGTIRTSILSAPTPA
jgi:hypothetical protein